MKYLLSIVLCICCICGNAQVLDSAFGTNGRVVVPFDASLFKGNSEIYSIALQTDGKIIAVGNTYDTTAMSIAIMRFTTAGIVDSSFGANGRILQTFDTCDINGVVKVLVQQDDKIVIAGTSNIKKDVTQRSCFSVARYKKDGSLDSTFNGSGLVKVNVPLVNTKGNCRSAALQADGKMLLAGRCATGMVVMRLLDNGGIDSTFNNDGIFFIPISDPEEGFSQVAVSGNKIIAFGDRVSQTASNVLWQLKQDGTPDSSFGTNGMVAAQWSPSSLYGNELCILPDKRIVISGFESWFMSTTITAHNADGTPDANFGVNGLPGMRVGDWTIGTPAFFTADEHGRIYSTCAGYDNSLHYAVFLFRHNINGTIDSTFSPYGVYIEAGKFGEYARTIIVQKDGKVLLAGGKYISYTNEVNFYLMRFNTYPLGIADKHTATTRMSVYPNPAHEQLNVTGDLKAIKSYTIINTVGQTIQYSELTQNTIDIFMLPTGVYTIYFKGKSGEVYPVRFSKN